MADERDQERWLSELLDAAAEEYEPNPDRLKAMVTARIAQREEQGAQAAPRSTRRARRRGLGLLGRVGLAGIPVGVALSTIGAAAALAVGATATIAVTTSHDHHTVSVAAPSTSPDPTGASSSSPSPTEGASSAATTEAVTTHPATSASGTPVGTSSSTLEDVTASIGQASNSSWSELDLAVTIKQPLTALHVTVKVSKSDGLSYAGKWNSGASGQFNETATTNSDGSVTYEFDLVGGDQVGSGTVIFAAQFNHATSGWKPQDDTYYVAARTATSTSASVANGAY
jgi:hypothetical protein